MLTRPLSILVSLLLAACCCAQVPGDPAINNGPLISDALARYGVVTLEPRDYYLSTPIHWPRKYGGKLQGAGGYTALIQGPNVGVTRLIWNGPPGEAMIEGAISGGRIAELVIQGALKGDRRAGVGIRLLNDSPPPTGFTVIDQVSYCNLDTGFQVANHPRPLWGNCITHRECMWHGVTVPYHVQDGNEQSTRHVFYSPIFNVGYDTIFDIESGGPLYVTAPYIGSCDGGTLLKIGRSNSGNGVYEIHGAQVDGNAKRLTLVEHGKYAHKVRIDGSYSVTAKRNGLAEPLVKVRELSGPAFHDVQVDMTNGVRWPE